MQSVYAPSHRMGGWSVFSESPLAHTTETSPLVTDANRIKLYAEWRRFWNVSQGVLVEKSPIHTMKTRFLQAMFSPERSMFVVVMRHPFPAMRTEDLLRARIKPACLGIDRFKRWLHIHQTLFEDLPHIRNYVVLHFEELIASDHPYGAWAAAV